MSERRSIVNELMVSAYTVPTASAQESDGTLTWDSTTMILVEVKADNRVGLGWTYADPAIAPLIRDKLAVFIVGREALNIGERRDDMLRSIRNLGRPGLCSMAVAAVDNALWDLKARLLGLPLLTLLGGGRDRVPLYGSGGFIGLTETELDRQVREWMDLGLKRIKVKIGRDRRNDIERLRRVRDSVGSEVQLYVDANGAYTRRQALEMLEDLVRFDVKWFEEPVSSDDIDGLRRLRDLSPGGLAVTAGEYAYDVFDFRRLLAAGAVDVLQVDATRCGGISGFMAAIPLSDAFHVPLSSHTAPWLHLQPCCAVPAFHSLEYFFDHVRIEKMFFESGARIVDGDFVPDLTQPGLGLQLRRADAEPYRVS